MKSKHIKLITSLLLLFIISSNDMLANEKDIQISLNLGVGFGVNSQIEYLPAITGLLNANVSFDELLFSVRNHRMIEFPQFFGSSALVSMLVMLLLWRVIEVGLNQVI